MNKPVDFSWCNDCKHWEVSEEDFPCDECLGTFTNVDSHKPVKFEEKE